jgi:phage tail P2-like protein
MPTTYDEHLLPLNATQLEKVLSAAGKRVQEIPVPIDLLKRPQEVPVAFLPHLAYEFSVDIWDKTWPEALKRSVTDASIGLHERKGTAYVLKKYIEYSGGEVVAITRPPQRVFSGPSITPEAREAWLSGLPQVRTWLIQEEGSASPRKLFSGTRARALSSVPAPLFRESRFAIPSNALSRMHRRARWVVGGVETETTVTDYGAWFRLHIAADIGYRVISGDRPRVRSFYVPSTAWSRLVTIRPTEKLPWRVAVTPSLQAVQSKPDRVAAQSTAGRRVIGYRPPYRRFFIKTSAPIRLYDRYAVFDGTSPARRTPVQFMGRSRYGFPMHRAEVAVRIKGHRRRIAAGDGINAKRKRFWLPHDPEPLGRVMRAARGAKRLSDRVLLDIGPRPRFVAGRPFFADTEQLVVGSP